jgi:hypothetical protein
MDKNQAKAKRKELRNAKRWNMEQAVTNDKRKEISKSFKTAFRAVKRSERNKYKNDIKREFGV